MQVGRYECEKSFNEQTKIFYFCSCYYTVVIPDAAATFCASVIESEIMYSCLLSIILLCLGLFFCSLF
jgi:hypothetical protein